MVRRIGRMRRGARIGLLGAVALLGAGTGAAHATVSLGACCLPAGQCQSLTQFDCELQSGEFFGLDSSCTMVNCATEPVGAPLLSVFGAVAALGALAGLGAYRLLPRR